APSTSIARIMRILFVDDDPILREFAAANLAGDGVAVATASHAGEALAAIGVSAPDVLVLGLDPPRREGAGLLASLRAAPRWRDLPVIAVAQREDLEALDEAFEAGATSFAVKPLNWRLLGRQIRYVHREAGRRRAAAARLAALASQGARFAAQAMACDPALKAEAVAFARSADAALTSAPLPEDAGAGDATGRQVLGARLDVA
ncbi:MAG: response regulator, partial [Caulobacteraceae bacterium]